MTKINILCKENVGLERVVYLYQIPMVDSGRYGQEVFEYKTR